MLFIHSFYINQLYIRFNKPIRCRICHQLVQKYKIYCHIKPYVIVTKNHIHYDIYRSAWILKRVRNSSQSCCSITHAIKTWVRNFKSTGSTLKKGGSVKTVRTPENIAIVREAIERSPHRSARRHSVSLGLSEISSLQSSSTPHSSGVETSNSARSHRNSCGEASKSNGWRSQETYRVSRAEWWSSEWCYFRKVVLLFSLC